LLHFNSYILFVVQICPVFRLRDTKCTYFLSTFI